jgi:ABC-2 type transport system ATP-binding protein
MYYLLMDHVISTSGLSKCFGGFKALDDVSIEVEKSSVFGFLGPNGAGKTTTIRILSGLLKPTSGSMSVLGRDSVKDSEFIRSKCGVQTDTNLYEKLTVQDNLVIWGQLYGLEDGKLKDRINHLLEMFNLEEKRKEYAGSLSKGMKQKLSIARALIHEPEVLFLDEPTAGLDPEASEDLLHYLQKYVKDGERTVFLCSHRLEEVESLCEKVALINQGRILASGSIPELAKKIWGENWFTIKLRNVGNYSESLKKNDYVSEVVPAGDELRVSLKDAGDIPKVVKNLVSSGAEILGVNEEKHTLKDIYFSTVPKTNHEH